MTNTQSSPALPTERRRPESVPNAALTPCRHPRKPHTICWWLHDPNDPVPAPYSQTVDNRADAMEAVTGWLQEPHISLRWVKVFRADNEHYECFRWENPDPIPEPEPVPAPVVTRRRRWWQRRSP